MLSHIFPARHEYVKTIECPGKIRHRSRLTSNPTRRERSAASGTEKQSYERNIYATYCRDISNLEYHIDTIKIPHLQSTTGAIVTATIKQTTATIYYTKAAGLIQAKDISRFDGVSLSTGLLQHLNGFPQHDLSSIAAAPVTRAPSTVTATSHAASNHREPSPSSEGGRKMTGKKNSTVGIRGKYKGLQSGRLQSKTRCLEVHRALVCCA